jgi:hypothetical protein
MKNLALPIGVFVLAVIAGIVLMLIPGKSQAPIVVDPHADLIAVDSPKPNDAISSTTITITGKARGSWYFEASFPIQILDARGAIIAQGPAQAQRDWMTAEFVPFTATLAFPAQPAGSKGVIVLKKDNPSGDPARDDLIKIPVTFN